MALDSNFFWGFVSNDALKKAIGRNRNCYLSVGTFFLKINKGYLVLFYSNNILMMSIKSHSHLLSRTEIVSQSKSLYFIFDPCHSKIILFLPLKKYLENSKKSQQHTFTSRLTI